MRSYARRAARLFRAEARLDPSDHDGAVPGVVVNTGSTAHIDTMLYFSPNADVVVTAKRTFRNLVDLDEPRTI